VWPPRRSGVILQRGDMGEWEAGAWNSAALPAEGRGGDAGGEVGARPPAGRSGRGQQRGSRGAADSGGSLWETRHAQVLWVGSVFLWNRALIGELVVDL
jgi:hypothetical protein